MRITIGVLAVNLDPESAEGTEMVTNAAVRALGHAGYGSIVTRSCDCGAGPLKNAMLEMCETCDIVFTAGGSGFAPEDVVPEVTLDLIDKQAVGIAELIRADLHKRTETSHLNRGIAGIRGRTVIINLPSTPETVKEGIETVSLLLRPMMSAVKGQKVVQDVH